MFQSKSSSTLPPALYVVATPIGNFNDLSARAIEILKTVSLILAEDTRVTGQLLKAVGVKTRTISFNAYSEAGKIPRVIDWLRTAQFLSLVVD